jgi:hypothetical protein
MDLDLNSPSEPATPAEAFAEAFKAVGDWLKMTRDEMSKDRSRLLDLALSATPEQLLERHRLTNKTVFDVAIENRDANVLLALVVRLATQTTKKTEEEEDEDINLSDDDVDDLSWAHEPPPPPPTSLCAHKGCVEKRIRDCTYGECHDHCIARLASDPKLSTCDVLHHRARARARREAEVKSSPLVCKFKRCKLHSQNNCITGRCSKHCAEVKWRDAAVRCPCHHPTAIKLHL